MPSTYGRPEDERIAWAKNAPYLAIHLVPLEQRSVRNGRDFDHLAEGDRQSGRIMIGWPARAAAVAVRHRGELHVDTSMVAQCDGQWT